MDSGTNGSVLGNLTNLPHARQETRQVPRKNRVFSVVEDHSNAERLPRKRRGSASAIEIVRKSAITFSKGFSTKLVKLDIENKDPALKDECLHDEINCGTDYEGCIFEFLRRREKGYIVDSRVLTLNDPKREECRKLLIDWLILVAHKLALCQETLYHMVNLIDRTFAMNCNYYDRAQLMGVTCLYISSKLEEYYPASISVMRKLAMSSFEKNDVFQMEVELLQLHNFNVHGVEPMTFMNRLILISNYRNVSEFKETVIFLYDSLLTSKLYSALRCSLVSASAVCGALVLFDESWPEEIVLASKYEDSEVALVTKKMLMTVLMMKNDAGTPALNGVRRKYSSKSQHEDIYNSSRFEKTNIIKSIHQISKQIRVSTLN